MGVTNGICRASASRFSDESGTVTANGRYRDATVSFICRVSSLSSGPTITTSCAGANQAQRAASIIGMALGVWIS